MSCILGFLDVETTGIEQEKGHRIIEFAVIVYSYEPATYTATRMGEYVTRINPQRPIDAGAFAVHHISYEDVAACPTWAEVAPKIYRIMNNCHVIVAHNGDGFDLPFINAELTRIGSPLPDVQTVDSMTQARWATPAGKYPKLGELCFASDVPYDLDKAHGALYDCEVMASCFFENHKTGFFTLPFIAEKEAA